MIGSMVPEFHLDCFCPDRESEQLMAHAHTKDRDFGVKYLPGGIDCVIARLRIPRPIGKKYSVRPQCQNFIGTCLRRQNRDSAAALRQFAENISLGSKIQRYDMQ